MAAGSLPVPSVPEASPGASPGSAPSVAPYDAVLLVSFGGPEGPDDVVPFLRNVTRGRDIPEERLIEVGRHYLGFGGRSPINDQNRALLAAVEEDLASHDVRIPVYWGNRNWHPLLAETLAQMRDDGVTRAACFVTSAYSSYSGCRQYREDLAGAEAAVEGAPRLDRLRGYFNHPGFVEPMVDNTLAALAELADEDRHQAHLVFVTHSVPTMMAESSGPIGDAYVNQHRSVVDEVVEQVRDHTGHRYPHELVYCSRSGSPRVPWLEPDVNDHLRALADKGVRAVAVVPIGFVSDHMEVVYDLDTEAAATAAELGLGFVRAATCGVDPRFVGVLRELLLERAATERGEQLARAAVGSLPAPWDLCERTCCPNPRAELPSIGQLA
ncbi:ferrochelatase [Nocardioides terrisoli]|uniref:ferrochelatase n=1 Tax=Nocardioides terrisoli TaxID=3388267 RepID=UPI00287B965F|nr:ferrochelatase [Nocardioides marmorisolisilvae]